MQPKITITNIIWSFDHTTKHVNLLLVKRADAPFKDYWALPETVMRPSESADTAALRLVREKIGLELASFHTEQLATFTQPNRVPGDRSLSLAYMTFLPEMPPLTAGYGAADARWFTFDYEATQYRLQNDQLIFHTTAIKDHDTYYNQLTDRSADPNTTLGFDHDWILKVACQRICNKLDYQPNILLILGDYFTLKRARTVFAVFQQVPLESIDNSNFKKNHKHLFKPVGTSSAKHPGRPAKEYQLNYFDLTNE
ncbi:ADP-ribose pyrophosphatase [Secundilactobacillus paracollinoides]|uniref:ADP-ribose pyrophosphatase n=1 Tax=Secundilactobacillus paracollinoides TaxID=240427 RepID=A0A1B2IW00_9LACO|nr:NUDIX domain-containing protein [Secundilactobacillus paracollinoides]ANZ60373.1 ADP-ribose pyrophosphatase [Secundilactobacillus paracollinoides]ANZ65350.1 ADP-ribose pyrophosphatase [Secundilactobacillus paracollinoides]ANZ66201.1 ADP-ribose pyrophosphatase [Secundilactobacillus paracollinoides]KRL75051.1 nudix-related transcriptional regulator [Secundilactobacillus paracollinoides DSM 15502 = JCM 11969]